MRTVGLKKPRASRRAHARHVAGPAWAGLAAVAALASVVLLPTPAAADITLLDFPHELVALDEWFTVSWEEPVRCRIDYGWAPGYYIESTNTEGVQSLTLKAIYEDIDPGIHFCVLADVNSSDVSGEFVLIIESPILPGPTAPPGGSVLHETTTLLEWDPVDGVPYYHVIVSDTEAEIIEVEGEFVLDGANLIWQAITGGTAIQYGSLDPSGHFVASNGTSPPLMAGFDYNWFILNNYGNHPLLTSVAGSGISSFTVDVAADLTRPELSSPSDSVAITEDLVEFEWDDVGASVYYLYIHEHRALGGGEASYPVWSGATTEPRAEVHVGSFLVSGDYRWRVVAIDEAGRGVATDTRGFVFATDTGTARVVTEAAGDALPWVLTEIEFLAGGIDLIPVVTNENGIAERELVPGDYLFHATKQGFVDTTAQATIEADQTEAVRIEMRRAPERIRGVVIDEVDDPVFGADVLAARGEEIVDGTSDANGNFVLEVDSGTWALTAEKQGYEPAGPETVTVAAGTYLELDEPLTLVGNPGVVTGNVINHGGGPVAGATVRAEGDNGASAVTTGATGRFALELAQGRWSVRAEKSGFQASDPREVVVSPGGSVEIEPAIVLEPIAFAIVGRVTDGQAAIVGADVVAVPSSGEPVETVTNGYGEFVLVPPAATYQMTAAAQGFGASRPHQITLESGESFTGVELPVRTLDGLVSGHVVSAGTGVPEALVTDGSAWTLTGPDGGFSLAVSHGLHELRASKAGYLSSPPMVIGTSPDQSLEGITLEVAEGAGSIAGRVTHGADSVAEAVVSAEAPGSSSEARTNADGEFVLPVEAGDWTVTASKDGFGEAAPVGVVLAAGQSATGIELAVDDESALLRGSITDSRGPVRRATILLFADGAFEPSYRTSSSANGQYAARVAPDTEYVLEAAADAHGSARATVPGLPEGAVEILNLTMPSHDGSIAGVVTDAGGAPIEGARAVASWGDSTAARTDRLGAFAIWLEDGLYDVRVDCPGYRSEHIDGIEAVSGVATDLEVELDPVFASVEGLVTHSTLGTPLAGVLVTAAWQGGAASAMTGADGRYELDSVVPGAVAVQLSRAGYRSLAMEATPAESEAIVVDAGLVELTGVIAGTVRRTGFAGIAGATVRAKAGEFTASTSWTDAEGRYTLSGLDPELQYSVYAWREAYHPDSENPLLDVPAETADADFAMLPSTGRIAGRVLDAADSTALAGAAVTASDGLGHFGSSTADEDGSFAIDALPPLSSYGVSAVLSGYFDVTIGGVVPGAEDVTIALPRNFARISGRLIPSGDGVVFGDMSVVATNTAFGGESALAEPDELGDFEIVEVRPGSYVVSVSGVGYATTPAQVAISVAEGQALTDIEFTVERAAVERVEVTGPTVVEAGGAYAFSGDAFAAGNRLIDVDLVWSLAPACAGEIEPVTGVLACDPGYLGELTLAAREPESGVVGHLDAAACAVVGPSTEAVYSDSAGLEIAIVAGALEETKTIHLSHEKLPDVKRLSDTFEVHGPSYRLKPNGLAFRDGSFPTLSVPAPWSGAAVVLWNRDLLRWERQESEAAPGGLSLSIARLGEYATIVDSRGLGVADVRIEPNPFSPDNGPVEISYDLSSDRARMPFVTVRIYNMTGQLVREVATGRPQAKGRASVEWDGTTDDAEIARNGRYMIEIKAKDTGGDATALATAVLVK